MKLTSDIDVEVWLASTLKDPHLTTRKLEVILGKGRKECYIKPKGYLGDETWHKINSLVHMKGGKWDAKNKLWTVPLEKQP